jgi:hypothetical protein
MSRDEDSREVAKLSKAAKLIFLSFHVAVEEGC